MDYFINLFNKICTKMETKTSLKEIINTHGFKLDNFDPSILLDNGQYLTTKVFKENGSYSLIIEVSTNTKYACYSDQEESYFTTISLYENNNLLNANSYTYFY